MRIPELDDDRYVHPLLTIVVPAYDAAAYLDRALSPLRGVAGIEVVVVDDGSRDDTGAIADRYAAEEPEIFRVIHQRNAGHGGAINAGIAAARGTYLKVLDADDWIDRLALTRVLTTLTRLERTGGVDALVTNYVHERVGRSRRTTRYSNVMPAGHVFGWEEVGEFGRRQYLMMHALTYRTALLREAELTLPEHTFYVDNLYVVRPLAHTRRLYYLDVDLYRYFIGRADQSVNDAVMVRRVDQQLRVTRLVLAALPHPDDVPQGLYGYLLHHVEVLCGITSALLVRAGGSEHLEQRRELWREIKHESPWIYSHLRHGMIGTSANLPGPVGRRATLLTYRVARRVVGFS
ncbi:glycosyltransferase family 2 protein [Microbacterium sediminis]|uniref:glycosyltransferase family 2 protein n=1 Tax=Microbacterium sediminis TaxID=904291 RepID=UPI000A6806C5|nr:glycosyltransferase family A protein [Microbacterium sediminis]